MTADSEGIGKGVLIASLGTVVGGLVLALVLRSLGYLSTVGHWIAGARAWLWHVLTFPVPVPLAVLLVAVGMVAYTLRAHSIMKRAAPSTHPSAQLSADEETIIRLLVQLDGQWATLDDIAARTHRSNLITGRALALLHDRGFIGRAPGGTLYPPTFGLDGAGVEYAYRVGYVR